MRLKCHSDESSADEQKPILMKVKGACWRGGQINRDKKAALKVKAEQTGFIL